MTLFVRPRLFGRNIVLIEDRQLFVLRPSPLANPLVLFEILLPSTLTRLESVSDESPTFGVAWRN